MGDNPLAINGLTMRDWFAGQALAGMLATEGRNAEPGYQPEWAAERSYQMADAMLEARLPKEMPVEEGFGSDAFDDIPF